MIKTTETLVNNPERLETILKEIPPEPGIYIMREKEGNILYIGKSKKLRSRVRSYFRDSQKLSHRIAIMVQLVTEIEFIVTDTEAEALTLEANLIKQHQPYYNVLLKDDKKYPYICITWSEEYPRIFITRKRRIKNTKDKYFGPYVDSRLLRETLGLVYRIFPLRQRKKPLFKDRPCLNYDIGRCPGVCQALITPEEYRQTMLKVQMIFQGRSKELIATLTNQMEKAATELNYEQAANIRDQIKALNSLNTEQKVADSEDTTARDAIALASDAKHCCIQLFQMRGGHLVARLGFFAEVSNPPLSKGKKELTSPPYQGGVGGVNPGKETTSPVNYPPLSKGGWGGLKPGKETTSPVNYPPLSKGGWGRLKPEKETTSPPYQGGVGGVNPGAILQQVLEQHYWMADPVEIPSEILLQHELPDGEMLSELLTEIKGKKVNLIVPQRQKKAELVSMVARNASYELERTQRHDAYNTEAMEDLATILDLPELPQRIEGYDISHIQGSNAVASQVVFINGIPAKQHYRHYKIKNPTVTIGHSDDFASMAEVIKRRFQKYIQKSTPDTPDKPDLIMIDGGKGQLSAVVAVLQEMNLLSEVKVCSLAKQREEIFLPGESEPLPTNSEQTGVQLLRRVRDEAHRFAVSFHRQQRQKKAVTSQLDDIPGLGFQRQKELLAYFGSLNYIRQASPEKLAEVNGIGNVLAQEIYNYFHPAN